MDKRNFVETYFTNIFDSFDYEEFKFSRFICSFFSVHKSGKDPINHVETKAQDPKVSRLMLVQVDYDYCGQPFLQGIVAKSQKTFFLSHGRRKCDRCMDKTSRHSKNI